MAKLVGPSCLIESSFKVGENGSLETVLFANGQLHHLFRDDSKWNLGQTPPSPATGPASMIQSDFGSGNHKNFEVVSLEGRNLVHWWHDDSNVSLPWQRGQVISTNGSGAGCIIQSDFGSGSHKNFEVVVLEGNNLVHYWHDNSNVGNHWQRGQTISSLATGPGCIIQSNFHSGKHGSFEVVVPEGRNLAHWWHDNADVSLPWKRGQIISTDASGPGCIIQSKFSGPHGNFEVVVLEGNNLAHWWHDNSNVASPWQRGQIISVASTGPGYLIQSSFGPGGPGNFEVLSQER
jgi:hypothetical protein